MKDRTELYPDRETWLAARSGRIGSSLVGDILARPWDALATLSGLNEPTAADRRRFERGHRFEAAVLEQYGEETGEIMLPAGEAFGAPGALVIVRHPTEAWASTSPDGLTPDLSVIGEAKTWGTAVGLAREDIVIPTADAYDPAVCPQYIAAQAYWHLEVTRVEAVAVAFLVGGYRLRVVRFLADPAAQAAMLDQVGEWRERHVIRGEPLPTDGSEACRAVAGTWLPARPGSIDPTPDLAALVADRLALTAERQAVEARAEALKSREREHDARILAAIRDAEPTPDKGKSVSIYLPGVGKWLAYTVAGRETVAVSELRRHPELYQSLTAAGLVSVGQPYTVVKGTLPKES